MDYSNSGPPPSHLAPEAHPMNEFFASPGAYPHVVPSPAHYPPSGPFILPTEPSAQTSSPFDSYQAAGNTYPLPHAISMPVTQFYPHPNLAPPQDGLTGAFFQQIAPSFETPPQLPPKTSFASFSAMGPAPPSVNILPHHYQASPRHVEALPHEMHSADLPRLSQALPVANSQLQGIMSFANRFDTAPTGIPSANSPMVPAMASPMVSSSLAQVPSSAPPSARQFDPSLGVGPTIAFTSSTAPPEKKSAPAKRLGSSAEVPSERLVANRPKRTAAPKVTVAKVAAAKKTAPASTSQAKKKTAAAPAAPIAVTRTATEIAKPQAPIPTPTTSKLTTAAKKASKKSAATASPAPKKTATAKASKAKTSASAAPAAPLTSIASPIEILGDDEQAKPIETATTTDRSGPATTVIKQMPEVTFASVAAATALRSSGSKKKAPAAPKAKATKATGKAKATAHPVALPEPAQPPKEEPTPVSSTDEGTSASEVEHKTETSVPSISEPVEPVVDSPPPFVAPQEATEAIEPHITPTETAAEAEIAVSEPAPPQATDALSEPVEPTHPQALDSSSAMEGIEPSEAPLQPSEAEPKSSSLAAAPETTAIPSDPTVEELPIMNADSKPGDDVAQQSIPEDPTPTSDLTAAPEASEPTASSPMDISAKQDSGEHKESEASPIAPIETVEPTKPASVIAPISASTPEDVATSTDPLPSISSVTESVLDSTPPMAIETVIEAPTTDIIEISSQPTTTLISDAPATPPILENVSTAPQTSSSASLETHPTPIEPSDATPEAKSEVASEVSVTPLITPSTTPVPSSASPLIKKSASALPMDPPQESKVKKISQSKPKRERKARIVEIEEDDDFEDEEEFVYSGEPKNFYQDIKILPEDEVETELLLRKAHEETMKLEPIKSRVVYRILDDGKEDFDRSVIKRKLEPHFLLSWTGEEIGEDQFHFFAPNFPLDSEATIHPPPLFTRDYTAPHVIIQFPRKDGSYGKPGSYTGSTESSHQTAEEAEFNVIVRPPLKPLKSILKQSKNPSRILSIEDLDGGDKTEEISSVVNDASQTSDATPSESPAPSAPSHDRHVKFGEATMSYTHETPWAKAKAMVRKEETFSSARSRQGAMKKIRALYQSSTETEDLCDKRLSSSNASTLLELCLSRFDLSELDDETASAIVQKTTKLKKGAENREAKTPAAAWLTLFTFFLGASQGPYWSLPSIMRAQWLRTLGAYAHNPAFGRPRVAGGPKTRKPKFLPNPPQDWTSVARYVLKQLWNRGVNPILLDSLTPKEGITAPVPASRETVLLTLPAYSSSSLLLPSRAREIAAKESKESKEKKMPSSKPKTASKTAKSPPRASSPAPTASIPEEKETSDEEESVKIQTSPVASRASKSSGKSKARGNPPSVTGAESSATDDKETITPTTFTLPADLAEGEALKSSPLTRRKVTSSSVTATDGYEEAPKAKRKATASSAPIAAPVVPIATIDLSSSTSSLAPPQDATTASTALDANISTSAVSTGISAPLSPLDATTTAEMDRIPPQGVRSLGPRRLAKSSAATGSQPIQRIVATAEAPSSSVKASPRLRHTPGRAALSRSQAPSRGPTPSLSPRVSPRTNHHHKSPVTPNPELDTSVASAGAESTFEAALSNLAEAPPSADAPDILVLASLSGVKTNPLAAPSDETATESNPVSAPLYMDPLIHECLKECAGTRVDPAILTDNLKDMVQRLDTQYGAIVSQLAFMHSQAIVVSSITLDTVTSIGEAPIRDWVGSIAPSAVSPAEDDLSARIQSGKRNFMAFSPNLDHGAAENPETVPHDETADVAPQDLPVGSPPGLKKPAPLPHEIHSDDNRSKTLSKLGAQIALQSSGISWLLPRVLDATSSRFQLDHSIWTPKGPNLERCIPKDDYRELHQLFAQFSNELACRASAMVLRLSRIQHIDVRPYLTAQTLSNPRVDELAAAGFGLPKASINTEHVKALRDLICIHYANTLLQNAIVQLIDATPLMSAPSLSAQGAKIILAQCLLPLSDESSFNAPQIE